MPQPQTFPARRFCRVNTQKGFKVKNNKNPTPKRVEAITTKAL